MENNIFAQNIYFKGFNDRKINYLKVSENKNLENCDFNINIPSITPTKNMKDENDLSKLNVGNINSSINLNYQSLKNINNENDYVNKITNPLNFNPVHNNVYPNNNLLYINNNLNNNISSNLNSSYNFSQNGQTNEINESNLNKNIYNDMKNLDKVDLNNLNVNSFSNSRNINMKNNDFLNTTVNNENLLITNSQQKLNYINKKENNQINNNQINNNNENSLKQYNVNLNSNNLSSLNKNINVYENKKVENNINETIYNNIYQNNQSNHNINNTRLINIKSNLSNFMNSGILMNKNMTTQNKNISLNNYGDNIMNSLVNKSNDNKNLKLFDSNVKKINVETNNLVNNNLNKNISINNFTNALNNHLNNKNFNQTNNLTTMSNLTTYNIPSINNSNSISTTINNTLNSNLNNKMNLTNINTQNNSNINAFNKNMLLNSSNINNIINEKIINQFTTSGNNNNLSNLSKEINLTNFSKPNNNLINLNNNKNIGDSSYKVREVLNYDYINDKDNMKNVSNINEGNKNIMVNETSSNMNNINFLNRNLNLLNQNINNNNNNSMINIGNNFNNNNNNISNLNNLNNLNYMNNITNLNNYNGTNVLKNDKELKGNETNIDLNKDITINKNNIADGIISNNINHSNISTDNYANILKQLCTPIKSRTTNKVESLNENINSEELNSDNKFLGNNRENSNSNINENIITNENIQIDTYNNTTFNNTLDEMSLLQNNSANNVEVVYNEFNNNDTNIKCNTNKEGNNNIYELKKLNLFAENKKRDKQVTNESKSNKLKKSKTKVFFYINPKYIIEPLKRKIYQNMSIYIENLISDIKSIENKNRAEILTNLHNTSWFCMVFDFDGISKLLNVFNKYLIYSDSLIIPDVLILNKLESDNNMIKDNENNDSYIKSMNSFFSKSDKLELLNKKIYDYENNIIENVEKLNYLKELCNSLKEQVGIKKKKFLLLLEKAKLKNFTYKNKHLQTILDIDKKTKIDENINLNNEYYKIFKKINEGLNVLKKYSNIIISNQTLHNEIINNDENLKISESTISTDDLSCDHNFNEEDDISNMHLSPNNKHKRKNFNSQEPFLKADNSLEELNKNNDEINKKRKTIKQIKNLQWQKEDNEEWVDEFLDDF
ncbi:conserved Plasmodium protein, unknown function [Plasmodium gallinaceum]|uniref:Asparagine-rich protein n=1 Tax=Plasmodium gallinaceum TaxID=5849 RepID=A0A1J1H0A4_PLAGA|nr:conserved Plasmodium protein, unknown function [Plasmodium gallinaceum]CRG98177.1 conserved Plasmodium protein, unknown function [Plasmodium gallinaceum]